MAALTQLIGRTIDGKYRIERLLGKGGMGAVYLATHLGTERLVAVKVIMPEFMGEAEFVERFKREAKAAGRLYHPNVVVVTDFGIAETGTERLAYLVMEYLAGCTLAEVLDEESRLTLAWTADILDQVCSAVDEAHRQGIVHRDLKPGNIWLEPNRRGDYTVKVLDFGLASLRGGEVASEPAQMVSAAVAALPSDTTASTLMISSGVLEPESRMHSAAGEVDELSTLLLDDPSARPSARGGPSAALTRVGAVLGTPMYMSPEQARGERLDARSDIYSLGVIAYQMLSGKTPFSGTPREVLDQHRGVAPRPLADHGGRIPAAVEELVMSALAKNPEERPASAVAFSNALRARSEGLDSLVRQAITLCSERYSTFILILLVAYLPAFLVEVTKGLIKLTLSGSAIDLILDLLELSLKILTELIATLGYNGIFALVLAQMLVLPNRVVQFRPVVVALRKRLAAFVFTSGVYFLVCMVPLVAAFLLMVAAFLLMGMMATFAPKAGPYWIVLFALSGLLAYVGLKAWVNYCLYGPVVLVEGKLGRAALRRSRSLVDRSRRLVVFALIIQICVSVMIGLFVKVAAESIGPVELRGSLVAFYGLIALTLKLFASPLLAAIFALLYFNLRRREGETLHVVLREQFSEEDIPRAKWQQRMRDQLRTFIDSGS